jgi:hypothetical protein
VSAAVVERIITAQLRVWDAAALSHINLAPGAPVVHYQVHRSTRTGIDGPEEPYAMHFESGGRKYSCPLAAFQARTQPTQKSSAADAVAR